MPTLISAPDFAELGTYQARLLKFDDLGVVNNPFDPKKRRRQLKMDFELIGERDSRGKPLSHHVWINYDSLSQNSKAPEIAAAMMTGVPRPWRDVDYDSLIGKAVTLEILPP